MNEIQLERLIKSVEDRNGTVGMEYREFRRDLEVLCREFRIRLRPTTEMTATEVSDQNHRMALTYYRTVFEGRRPAFVPKRVRVLQTVEYDYPGGRGTRVDPGEYPCECNQLGAVWVMVRGVPLGLRPREFEVLEWRDAGV